MDAQDSGPVDYESVDPALFLEKQYKIRTVEYQHHWHDDTGYLYSAALPDLYEMGEKLIAEGSDLRLLQGMRLFEGRMEIFTYTPAERALRLFTDNRVILHTFEGVRVMEHDMLDVVDLEPRPVRDPIEDSIRHPYVDVKSRQLVWIHDARLVKIEGLELVAHRQHKFIQDLRGFLWTLPVSKRYPKFRWDMLTQALNQWLLDADVSGRRLHPASTVAKSTHERYSDFTRAYKFYDQLVSDDASIAEEAQYFKSMLGKLQIVFQELKILSEDDPTPRFRSLLADQMHTARVDGNVRLAALLRHVAYNTDPETALAEEQR